eukprot:COSAG03_NODE_188_length_10927_cov_5.525028_1_plen_53_part_00
MIGIVRSWQPAQNPDVQKVRMLSPTRRRRGQRQQLRTHATTSLWGSARGGGG